MEFSVVASIVSGLLVIGGIGWRAASELGQIRATLSTFIATSAVKLEAIEKKLEEHGRRIEKLEDSKVFRIEDLK